jgi:photosystem II stability/assembly factor-like uncharacterized protein
LLTAKLPDIPSGRQRGPVARGFVCASTADCCGRDDSPGTGTVVVTTHGGSTWESQSLPGGISALYNVSCANTSDCWAVGADSSAAAVVVVSTDGGSTWTEQPLPGDVETLSGVSCANTSDCWAAGQSSSGDFVLATTDGGTTWTAQRLPDGE